MYQSIVNISFFAWRWNILRGLSYTVHKGSFENDCVLIGNYVNTLSLLKEPFVRYNALRPGITIFVGSMKSKVHFPAKQYYANTNHAICYLCC